jgi:hypothetical protein
MAFMVESAKVDINAPIARVWAILINLDRYPDWNPFTFRVESSLKIGDPVMLHVHMNRAFSHLIQPETISAHEPNKQLGWTASNYPPLLLRANRLQNLEAISSTQTRYHTFEKFEGWIAPLVRLLFRRDIERGFNNMAQALKNYAESDRPSV